MTREWVSVLYTHLKGTDKVVSVPFQSCPLVERKGLTESCLAFLSKQLLRREGEESSERHASLNRATHLHMLHKLHDLLGVRLDDLILCQSWQYLSVVRESVALFPVHLLQGNQSGVLPRRVLRCDVYHPVLWPGHCSCFLHVQQHRNLG